MFDHLDDPNPPTFTTQRSDAVRRRTAALIGRRRRRRGLAGGTTALALIAAIVFAVASSDRSPTVLRVVAPTPPPNVCAGGQIPSGTDARVGAQVVYGWLPPGYHPVSATRYRGQIVDSLDHDNVAVGPASDVSEVTGVAEIDAGYLIGPAAWLDELDGTARPTITVQGHPAVINSNSVSWRVTPEVEVIVEALGKTDQVALLHIADTVTFDPGVTAPAVGDLGPVISRATAISEATSLASGSGMPAGNPTTVRSWLVTAGELHSNGAFALPTPNGSDPNVNNPQWLVLFTTPDRQYLVDVDAVNNRVSGISGPGPTTGYHTVDAQLAALVDHARNHPCPDS